MNSNQKLEHTNRIADAIQRGQKEYKFFSSHKPYVIGLPNPQLVGTMRQRRSYAIDKAQSIVQTLGEELVNGFNLNKVKMLTNVNGTIS